MTKKRNRGGTKGNSGSRPDGEEEKQDEVVDRMAEMMRRELDETLGPDATYEQRRDFEAELMRKVLRKREDEDLEESATNAVEVEVDDKRYRRLRQRSSATYHGRWGPHTLHEPLYREVGVRNGPTLKPVELSGIVGGRLTPDLARIAGELGADEDSRQLERILTVVGLRPPSRAVLEKRLGMVARELSERIEELEAESRVVEEVPEDIASVSCGLDRFAVRMAEPASTPPAETRAQPRRKTPYVRAVPPPQEHRWRMAWVGSMTTYNSLGEELRTWKYAANAGAAPGALAKRVAADAARVLETKPKTPVHVVQDGAPELRVLPEILAHSVPEETTVRTLIDTHPTCVRSTSAVQGQWDGTWTQSRSSTRAP